ncbi:Phage protein [Niallia circulans]|uniref:hypothetical protein n=1 Tax=Niallia circulans TaxID=1397 RepID=UPI00077C220D|nr:hypothetical protein [Niallia circulans]MDR4315000.1 hypothetical protein [Niallia circulans]MED3839724.1 hypothetical protein [Niallia circulans]MED4241209.1 hypothetical protein [Niallia circulans]MED4247870.1 hypothetical protein [Niallia circulans]QKH61647.1 hypothetical protein FOC77_13805 [Niallia circulans]
MTAGLIEQIGPLNTLKFYQDVCNQVEFYEELVESIENEWKIQYKLLSSNPTPNRNGGLVPVPMDIVAGRMDKISDNYDHMKQTLEFSKKMKEKAEQILSTFDGIKHKIIYCYYVQGMTLKEIAAETGYSYDYIKKLKSQIGRELDGEKLEQ